MTEVEVIDENVIDIELQDRAIRLTKLKAKWNASRSILAPLVNAFARIGIVASLSSSYVDISFSGDKHQLSRAVRILRTSGFETRADKPKAGDNSWSAFFEKEDCELRIYFAFSSSVCKLVKVGTKTVQQDVYETRCGDDISEELPGPTPAIEHAGNSDTPDSIPF